jgi:cytochrome bd-type quinol oxidase subunit 2
MSLKSAKRGVIISIICILILTVLEFPAPLGFETRPQSEVSIVWLVLFLVILVIEIAAAILIIKKPEIGANFAIVAAVLNIIQIIADQLHLMQPEVAPLAYTLLEYSV